MNIGPTHQHRVLRMTRKVIQPGRKRCWMREIIRDALMGSAAGLQNLACNHGIKRSELATSHLAR